MPLLAYSSLLNMQKYRLERTRVKFQGKRPFAIMRPA